MDKELTMPILETQATKEIDRLADFILQEFGDEPGRTGESESAVDVAIRLLEELKVERDNKRDGGGP